jgi:hypothetical protein
MEELSEIRFARPRQCNDLWRDKGVLVTVLVLRASTKRGDTTACPKVEAQTWIRDSNMTGRSNGLAWGKLSCGRQL